MTIQHTQLASGQWKKLSFSEQMANVGSEVGRALSWKKKEKSDFSERAFIRALELLNITINCHVGSKLKELTRVRELLIDYFYGDNYYHSSEKQWNTYFYAFNYAARVK